MDENLSSDEKEKVVDALNNYIVEFKPDYGKVSEIADMLSELTGVSSNKIQGYLMQLTGGDDEIIFQMDEGKKDHDGDGDIDSDDYLAARDKAIKANMKKKSKKESIETKLAEIGKEGDIVKLEAQLDYITEYIEEKQERLNSINEDENLQELIDKKKVKQMQKEIKLLEKRKQKMEKLYEKSTGKQYAKRTMVDEVEEVDESFDSLVKKVDKEKGYDKEDAKRVAGFIANRKRAGAGSGPTAKMKKREG
jgi:hypothetical protein